MMDFFHVPPEIILVVHIRAANVAVKRLAVASVHDGLMAPQIEPILEILLADLTVKEGGVGIGAGVRMVISHVAFEVKVAVEILVADVAKVRRRIS